MSCTSLTAKATFMSIAVISIAAEALQAQGQTDILDYQHGETLEGKGK